jgi:YfiH family protein
MSFHPDWIVPQWPAPATVRAVCTTRAGGISLPPYDSLNLGDHVGDDILAVGSNRVRMAQALQAHPVFLQQVHGVGVLPLHAHTPHGSVADACYTAAMGVACTIMVADCLPMLFTDAQGSFVAAAHAGWRGLAGMDEATGEPGGPGVVETLCRMLPVSPTELMVWIGPGIGPQAFEVGEEVRQAFVTHDPVAASCFRPGLAAAKWMADLAGLARLRLAAIGIRQVYGNDSGPEWCTFSQPSRFFSHRRDRVSGRFAACVWRVGD